MKRKFTPAIDLLLPSASVIRQNVFTYFVVMLIPSLILTYASRSVQTIEDFQTPLFFVGALLSLLFNAPLLYTQTKSSKGVEVSLTEAFTKGYHFFWRLLFLNVVVTLLVIGGFLLFIIPGFIMLRRYFVSYNYLIDNDCSIKEAMQLSARATKGNYGAVFGIIAVLFLFYLIGAFGPLGAVAAVLLQVLYSVAPAIRYQEFRDKKFKAADI